MQDLLDKYEISELISNTPSADVYFGELKGIEGFRRPVVIKRYRQLTQQQVITLAKDSNIMGLLNHANIVQILDLGKWNDQWTVVSEQVRGTTLTEFIEWCHEDQFGIKDELAAYIIHEIIRGVEYAHRQHPSTLPSHILHRNLSPDNILIGFQGNIKIKGFSTEVQLLQESRFRTPDSPCDARTDVWGVGAILHTMMVGMQSSDPLATQTSAPKKPLERLTQQAIHPNPNKRFQSIAAFKEALTDQFGEIPLSSTILMQNTLVKMKGEPFAVLGDDATYVSRTVAGSLLDTQEASHETVRMEVNRTDSLSLSSSAFQAHSESKVDTAPTTKPTSVPPPHTASDSGVSSDTLFGLTFFALIVGITLGWVAFRQVYQVQNTAQVHWLIPEGTQILLGEETITVSGHQSILSTESIITAIWVLSDEERQELKLSLQPGESRWINLECP